MNYQVDDNKLLIDGKIVFETPGKIVDTLSGVFNNETLLLIYDAYHLVPDKDLPSVLRKVDDPKLQEDINQNVICLDKKGNILWRIEPTIGIPIDHIRFTKNGPNYDDIWVYRRDAREFKIDPQNGKILDWRMGL